jgi:hypothetical protein
MARKHKTILDNSKLQEDTTIETTTTNSEAIMTTTTDTPRVLEDLTQQLNGTTAPSEEQQKRDDEEIEYQIALPRSVVAKKFKIRYKLLAKERGDTTKAAKRSKWDWLAQQMAELTLTDKAKLKVAEFEELMAANGIDCSRWPNRAPGWEGRLRMTACLVLRKQMADAADGVLFLADGTTRQMPEAQLAELVAKYA